jgi:hypothetical protein
LASQKRDRPKSQTFYFGKQKNIQIIKNKKQNKQLNIINILKKGRGHAPSHATYHLQEDCEASGHDE